jgi:hypothetical protein
MKYMPSRSAQSRMDKRLAVSVRQLCAVGAPVNAGAGFLGAMADKGDNASNGPGVPCEDDVDDDYFSLDSDRAICAAHRQCPEFRRVAGSYLRNRLQSKAIHSQS